MDVERGLLLVKGALPGPKGGRARQDRREGGLEASVSIRVDVLTPAGETAGSVELPDAVFDVQVNVPLIHQVVVGQLAAARQGTTSVKTRADVRGGGKKPYRQKGTGRARQGSIRAPQFTGGGVVHGPTPRDYSQRTPKKMKAAALRGALSDRARDGRVHVVDLARRRLQALDQDGRAVLALLSERRHVLVVLERTDQVSGRACATSSRSTCSSPDQLNTYDVLVSDDVVFTQGALEAFLRGPGQGRRRRVGAVPTRSPSEASKRAPKAAEAAEPRRSRRRGAESQTGGSSQGERTRTPMRPGVAEDPDPRDILSPISEKSYGLLDENKYTFMVAPGRQQDPDQDRRREGLRRQGDRRQHAQPPGQAQAHPRRLRQAQGHQARHRIGRRRPASRSSEVRSPDRAH